MDIGHNGVISPNKLNPHCVTLNQGMGKTTPKSENEYILNFPQLFQPKPKNNSVLGAVLGFFSSFHFSGNMLNKKRDKKDLFSSPRCFCYYLNKVPLIIPATIGKGCIFTYTYSMSIYSQNLTNLNTEVVKGRGDKWISYYIVIFEDILTINKLMENWKIGKIKLRVLLRHYLNQLKRWFIQ